MPCQVEEGRCSSGGGWGHTGWCHRRCCPCHVRWRRGGAAVVEGGATQGGVTGGVAHAMSGGGGEVQQWWRVGPHGVVSQEV